MKAYETYKDSGVEWLGEIPAHWEIKRLKFLGDAIGGVTYSPKDIVENENEGVLVLRSSNIQKGELYLDDNVYVNLEISEKKKLRKGDILICSRNGSRHLIGKNICIDERTEGETFGAFMMIFRSNSWEFLYQFFNSPIFKSQSGLFLTATINQLTSGTLNNFYLAIPESPEEQTQIANYLDHKTSQLDELVAKKEQLIILLQEERTAMINQAVTKGLDPNVPMKDSGIEWLGEIPAHWEVTKVKHFTQKIGSGVTPKGGAEVYQESGIPLLRSQNIYFDRFKVDNVAFISEEIHDSMNNSKVFKGDVLLNITGGSIGRCFYLTDEFKEANVNQHVCIVRPNENIITEYLHLLLISDGGQLQIGLCQQGGNREALNFEQLKNFPFALPNINEQLRIIKGVQDNKNRISNIIEKSQQEIDLLKEYKTALISEVVTGKVDVREAILETQEF